MFGHLAEDVVGRAVDDAHHPGDGLADERLAQWPHQRNRPGHRSLEQQVDTGGCRSVVELGAVVGQQLLVGGDDRLAGSERSEHQRAGRFDATDDLDDDVDVGIGDDGRCVGGVDAEVDVDAPVAGGAVHGDAADGEVDAGARGDLGALLGQQRDERGADIAATKETDAYRCHRHGRQPIG